MANGKEAKLLSAGRKVVQYIIGSIAILFLLILLIASWKVAIVVIVIGAIIWRMKKRPKERGVNATNSSALPAKNTQQTAEESSLISKPAVIPSRSTPVITVEYGINRSITRSREPGTNELQWASYEDVLEADTYHIEHPMTYWAPGKTRIAEASCIEKNLPVSKETIEPGDTLGYWPRYENMTPSQRGFYLYWLATGKKKQLYDIGYAFVYFYGLERRMLIDGKDSDYIIPEVIRLLQYYAESGSFNSYLSRFIAYTAAKSDLRYMTKDDFVLRFEQTPLNSYPEDLLAVILCWFYQHNLPLPPQWAFEVARQDVRVMRSVVVNRAPEQFMSLFMQKYHEKFGEGMMLKVSDRERLIGYHPASPSLLELGRSSAALMPTRIPNVLGIQSQFKPLIQIWGECIEELRAYSRAIGNGADATTREAFEALPPALRKNIDHPDAPRWEEIVTTYADDSGFSLIPVAKIAEIHGFEHQDKLTLTQSKALARTAEDIGLAIVPDARVTGRVYAWSDEIVLFRQDGITDSKPEKGYRAAVCLLELGMIIVGTDGTADPEEIDHIERFLENQFRLSPSESRGLKAYGLLSSKNPPSISSLSKQLRTALSTDQRAMIGKYLVGVAAANGIIDSKEISALKRIFKAMEINTSLDAILAELHQPVSQPVEIQTDQSKASAVKAIPVREPKGIIINDVALAHIMEETAEVSDILGKALCENESETTEPGSVDKGLSPATPDIMDTAMDISLPFSSQQLASLDVHYHAPLAELLTKQIWNQNEIAELAKRYQFMPSGMLDVINTWADETLNDVLIEEGNGYRINQSLIEAKV